MPERNLIMLPGSTNIPDRVSRAMIKPIIGHRGPEFQKIHKEIIQNAKYLFQTENDVFILTASGTGAVECAISNTVNPNDKILIPTYGLFSERMKEKINRRNGKPIEIPKKWGKTPKATEIKKKIEEEKDIKAIAIVYNETSTGATVRDLPKIGEIAKENDALLIVDAVSILGGDKLPTDKWNIDICITGSQKCLACPPGLSLISVSKKAWKKIEKTPRPFYFDLIQMKKFSQKNETPFTPAIPLIYALQEALKIIREEGLEKRIKRHKTCSEAFYNAFETMGLKILPEKENRSQTVIAIKKPKEVNNKEVRKIMKKRYKVVIAGGAGKLREEIFRIGCMGTISEASVLQTITALTNALKENGHPINIKEGIEAATQKLHT